MGTAKGPEGVAIDAWQVIARTWADAPGWSGTISTYGSCWRSCTAGLATASRVSIAKHGVRCP